MRLPFEPGQHGFGDARFTDARLAGEQHHPTLTGLGLMPTTQQQFHLLLPANEGRQRDARTPCLEPADSDGLAPHPPRFHRERQSLQLVGTERMAVEHPAY